jgi:hypothetical protein
MNERLVRPEVGAKHDAERDRKRDVILSILLEEAAEGRLYTINQFAEAFENKGGLGGKDTIRDRIAVQATKGAIKFIRDGAPYGLGPSRSRFGYLCVEGMVMPTDGEEVDPATGEVTLASIAVLPTHYKSPQTGALLEVENPQVWVYPEGERPLQIVSRRIAQGQFEPDAGPCRNCPAIRSRTCANVRLWPVSARFRNCPCRIALGPQRLRCNQFRASQAKAHSRNWNSIFPSVC